MRIGKLWFAPALARAAAVAIVLIASAGLTNAAHAQSSVRPPESSTGFSDPAVSGNVPGNTLGNTSNSEIWREIKGGSRGDVQVQDPNAGRLIQYEGQLWREIHNGPLPRYGAWFLLATIVALALAFTFMGRMKIEGGRSGRLIKRFNGLERAGHWMLASSFILLSLTGLNILYGRSVVRPIVGPEAFATLTAWGKYIHNYVAFAFIAGLIIMFVLWVAYNIPNRYDLIWLAKGGGMFTKTHAPAKKFNAGQKILYWAIMLGGTSIALSGWALLDPFSTHFMTGTFELLKRIGIDVPYLAGAAGAALQRRHGAADEPGLARGDGHPPHCCHHRAHLYRHPRHGGRVRFHGIGRGRRELGARAPRPMGQGPGAEEGRRPHDTGGRAARRVKTGPEMWQAETARSVPRVLILGLLASLGTAGLSSAQESGVWPQKLVGHGGPVMGIVTDPGTNRALTASFDYSVILWSLEGETGTVEHRLIGHNAAVNDVAFLPDGKRAISVSDDGSAIVWDLQAGTAAEAAAGERRQGARRRRLSRRPLRRHRPLGRHGAAHRPGLAGGGAPLRGPPGPCQCGRLRRGGRRHALYRLL